MSKAFVVLNHENIPVGVYVIPDMHTVSHYTHALRAAAEAKGGHGLLVDVQECGAPQAVDLIHKSAA